MYQQSLDLRFPLEQQLSLDLDVPDHEKLMTNLKTPLLMASTFNSYGMDRVRIDNTGLSLKVENKTWLKAKVANWLGLKYI